MSPWEPQDLRMPAHLCPSLPISALWYLPLPGCSPDSMICPPSLLAILSDLPVPEPSPQFPAATQVWDSQGTGTSIFHLPRWTPEILRHLSSSIPHSKCSPHSPRDDRQAGKPHECELWLGQGDWWVLRETVELRDLALTLSKCAYRKLHFDYS